MAEIVLRDALAKAGVDNVIVDSAGTATGHAGYPMHPEALVALANRGYDGSAHIARQWHGWWDRDLILAMDNKNFEALGGESDWVQLFGEVPDPYFGGAEDFAYALDMIEAGMPSVVSRICYANGMVQTAHKELTDLISRVDASLQTIDPSILDKAAGMLLDTRRTGKTVFICGNGGSAGLANHAACDLGIAGLRAISLSAGSEVITGTGNDHGYENVFATQLSRLSRPGDLLFAISSSGKSPNIIQALEYAVSHDLQTITLTGFPGSTARDRADAAIHIEAEPRDYAVVETAHQAVLHALSDYVKVRWSAVNEEACE